MNRWSCHGNDNVYRLLDQPASDITSRLRVSACEIGFELVVLFRVSDFFHPFTEAVQIVFHRIRKPAEIADLRLLSIRECRPGHRQSGPREKEDLAPRGLMTSVGSNAHPAPRIIVGRNLP